MLPLALRLQPPRALWSVPGLQGAGRASSEATVAGLEHSLGFLQTLMSKGLGAAWAQLQDSLGDVRAQVLGGVQAWVEKTVLTQAILKLVALFNPAGAVLQALQFTYNTVSFFLDKGPQIGAVVETYLHALGPIAEGKIGAAANAVEGALGRTVPLVLSFLAGYLGLNKLPGVLKAQLEKVRVPLDKALDRLVVWLLRQGAKVLGAVKAGGQQALNTVKEWLGIHEHFTTVDGAKHELYFRQGAGGPELVRASTTPLELTLYLDSLPTSVFSAGEITKAKALAAKIHKMTRTDNSTLVNTSRKDENEIVKAVQELSVLLIPLVVQSQASKPLPKAIWGDGPKQYTGGKHQFHSVDYLSSDRAKGGEGAVGDTPEMTFVLGNGWVRMHLITAAAGGKGQPNNWVPAPSSVNTSAAVLQSFERSMEELVRTQPIKNVRGVRDRARTGPKHPVLWVNVSVLEYHPPKGRLKKLPGFAKTIHFSHGLQLPPISPTEDWVKVTKPLSEQTVEVPLPPAPNPISLSNTTHAAMRRTGNPHFLDGTYGLTLRQFILKGGKFSSIQGPGKSLSNYLTAKVSANEIPGVTLSTLPGILNSFSNDLLIRK